MSKTICGSVCSGRGRAKSHVARFESGLSEIAGVKVVHGSLNLVLDRPIRLNEETAIFVDNRKKMLWPGVMEGLPIYVCRWANAPLHIMEVLSEKHLRSTLHLKDGDNVAIELHDCHLDSTNIIERVTWILIWAGRRQWHYSNDAYAALVRNLSRRLGCAQKRGWL